MLNTNNNTLVNSAEFKVVGEHLIDFMGFLKKNKVKMTLDLKATIALGHYEYGMGNSTLINVEKHVVISMEYLNRQSPLIAYLADYALWMYSNMDSETVA